MVALRGSMKNPQYQLSAHDEDLQDQPLRTGFDARGKEGSAIARALVRLGNVINQQLFLADFEVTRTAVSIASRYTPVEWRCERAVGHGDRIRNWVMMIDMDDIPAGAAGAGPDRPHIGFSYWCTGFDPVNRVNGHIFIEYVSASR